VFARLQQIIKIETLSVIKDDDSAQKNKNLLDFYWLNLYIYKI